MIEVKNKMDFSLAEAICLVQCCCHKDIENLLRFDYRELQDFQTKLAHHLNTLSRKYPEKA